MFIDLILPRQSRQVQVQQRYQSIGWRPAADIYQVPRGWLIKFELAGVRPEDIQLSVSGKRLTVEGIRRDWLCEEGECYHSMEISYNRFARSIDLPCDLDQAKVAMEYRDGMLLVRLTMEATRS